jgi:hypothetical protein
MVLSEWCVEKGVKGQWEGGLAKRLLRELTSSGMLDPRSLTGALAIFIPPRSSTTFISKLVHTHSPSRVPTSCLATRNEADFFLLTLSCWDLFFLHPRIYDPIVLPTTPIAAPPSFVGTRGASNLSSNTPASSSAKRAVAQPRTELKLSSTSPSAFSSSFPRLFILPLRFHPHHKPLHRRAAQTQWPTRQKQSETSRTMFCSKLRPRSRTEVR